MSIQEGDREEEVRKRQQRRDYHFRFDSEDEIELQDKIKREKQLSDHVIYFTSSALTTSGGRDRIEACEANIARVGSIPHCDLFPNYYGSPQLTATLPQCRYYLIYQ